MAAQAAVEGLTGGRGWKASTGVYVTLAVPVGAKVMPITGRAMSCRPQGLLGGAANLG